MEADAIVQLVTIVVAAMGIVWHQQHSTNQLRSEFREDNRQLREDFNTANRELREDFGGEFKSLREDHNALRDAVAQNGQRLARIEGHLGIGFPPTGDPSDSEPPSG
ncbi:MAG: hypothetical protein F4Z58_00560 [Acidimicrobiaceae bacterium]|nr:hypothetical protein [Acidimicrobiaceae bacterium]MYD07744.1 hypothetical protein [Acidimicrobiaceae bacterium]MYI57164.1 hypothetical protein [Acidimicrobiaceae bacterium]